MEKQISPVVLSFILLLASSPSAFAADETLNIVTYYPSPAGVYKNLTVMGNLGVGTMTPGANLEVNGGFYLNGSGDTQGDDDVDVFDALPIGQWAGGTRILTKEEYARADINGDGQVTMLDADLISSYLASQISLAQARHDVGKQTADKAVTVRYYSTCRGCVGVGTVSPASQLHVFSTGPNLTTMGVQHDTSWTGRLVGIGLGLHSTSGQYKAAIGFIGGEDGGYGRGDIIFAVDNTADASVVSSGDEKMRITRTGNVGIATTDPGGYRLRVAGGSAAVDAGQSWTTASDIRLKKDVRELGPTLSKVVGLRAVLYHTLQENTADPSHIGFIAQELENEFPELVITDKDGYKSVAYDKVTAVLLEAVKEQQREMEEQSGEIKQLKGRLDLLEAKLSN